MAFVAVLSELWVYLEKAGMEISAFFFKFKLLIFGYLWYDISIKMKEDD